MADRARRDVNRQPTLLGVSNADSESTVDLWADPSTHALLISGTVTASPASNGATGAAVPASADYEGINVGGTLRGVTGVNPSGTVYAQQVDLASVGGTTFALGQALAAASIPVVLTAAQITTLTPLTSVTVTQATASSLNATVVGTGTFAVQATPVTQVDTFMLGGVNIKEINAVAPLMGNGGTGTGALRVALVNDGTGRMATVDTVTAVTTVSTLTNQTQEGGVNISLNAGAVDTGTRRIVQANGAGKTIVSTGGSAASNGNNTLVSAGTNKLKVFAFSLSTTSTSATTCIFQSGASGTELWRVLLQAGTSVSTGANLAVAPPAWLFATAAATLLNLNLSGANTIHWSASYFDEA